MLQRMQGPSQSTDMGTVQLGVSRATNGTVTGRIPACCVAVKLTLPHSDQQAWSLRDWRANVPSGSIVEPRSFAGGCGDSVSANRPLRAIHWPAQSPAPASISIPGATRSHEATSIAGTATFSGFPELFDWHRRRLGSCGRWVPVGSLEGAGDA
jgi:hypothetical protein